MKIRIALITGLCLVLAVCLAACGTSGSGSTGQQSGSGSEGGQGAQGENVSLVTTQGEAFADDSAWIGTFQLCWNSLMDTINSGEPVSFDGGNSAQVDALNQRLFDEKMLSEDHYYTYAGKRTLAAKEEIEQAIKDKFDQESDILDQFDWTTSDNTDAWLMYAMLYRKFTFENAFDDVRADTATFGSDAHGNKAQGVKYFGCDDGSDDAQRNQVQVMYYDDENSHAVSLFTEQDDRVVLVKNPEGKTAAEMFKNAMTKADEFEGDGSLRAVDTLSVPELNIDEFVEFKELAGKTWVTPSGDAAEIEKAIQTLKFKLDKEGGEVKSEAGIAMKETSMPDTQVEGPRSFEYDDRYALFLVDDMAKANSGEDETMAFSYTTQQPYLAVLVNDITKFQAEASAQ